MPDQQRRCQPHQQADKHVQPTPIKESPSHDSNQLRESKSAAIRVHDEPLAASDGQRSQPNRPLEAVGTRASEEAARSAVPASGRRVWPVTGAKKRRSKNPVGYAVIVIT